jgi:hypothetical protein
VVEKLIHGDLEAEALFRKETTAPHGGDRVSEAESKSDNITLAHDRGTSRAYTLARLADQHPDLFSRVTAGDL